MRWFYATDIATSKPPYYNYVPSKKPTKFEPFSQADSQRIERHYQRLRTDNRSTRIQVKEDGLFQVDIVKRRIMPVYWDGPTYEIRRGLWFYESGKKCLPCTEEVSSEIEYIYQTVIKEADADSKTKQFQLNSDPRFQVKFSESGTTAWLISNDTIAKITSLGGGQKIVRGYYEEHEEEPDEDKEQSDSEQYFENLYLKEDVDTTPLEEKMMSQDYEAESYHRDVDHLVLCVHGIGQRLSQKIDSVNFVHDINMFRKLMKQLFATSVDLQMKLNPQYSSLLKHSMNESKKKNDSNDSNGKYISRHDRKIIDSIKNNPRIQVLPVLWRQEIAFGMTPQDRKSPNDVTLQDINVDGVASLRNVVGDVIIDFLLYNNSVYRDQIVETVVKQLNKIYKDFCERTPEFADKGKVSIIGHSLGSAIGYDILSKGTSLLDFKVKNFFTLGSPVGLLQLLNRSPITQDSITADSFYNIFHPCDPVSYRVEPLIHPLASQQNPMTIPYTKGGLLTQIQELSELGQKISQGATSVWNNISLPWLNDSSASTTTSSTATAMAAAATAPTTTTTTAVNTDKTKLSEEQRDEVTAALSKLNSSNKRVDYVLQEGVLDISLIAALASHMAYFENPDVSSFVMKELLK